MINIDEKVQQFTSILTDVAADSRNILRTAIHFHEMRPLVDDDLIDDIPLCKGASRAGFYCYEDAGMTTGAFLSSQSLRYTVTGDVNAKDNADRAYAGIRCIYDMGRQKAEGFFPKPYDGRISDQISRDQYLFVMNGLANYHAVANSVTRREIEDMLSRMADYWMGINYTDSYFGLPASSHLNDFMGSLFLGLIRIPFTYTGDRKYLVEYERLYHEEKLGARMPETLRSKFLEGETYDGAMYFRQQENPVMMKCMAIDHLWETDSGNEKLWQESLQSLGENELLIALDQEDCLNYFIIGFNPVSQSTFLTPPGIITELENPLNIPTLNWGGLRKTAGSAQTAYAAVVIANRMKNKQAAGIALRIIERLDISSFRGLTVPDENHIPPGCAWKTKILNTSYMAYWLWSYWLGRQRNLW